MFQFNASFVLLPPVPIRSATTVFFNDCSSIYDQLFSFQSQKDNQDRLLLDKNLTMIYGLLLLLVALAHHATSLLIDHKPSITSNSTNVIVGHCFTPLSVPGIKETNLRDCRVALNVLARVPDFTTRFSFSKNPRRGIKVPRGWLAGDCIILVSCENDRDAWTFRFADVLAVAKRIIDACVGEEGTERWEVLRWGGVEMLGASETFYVSVGRPAEPSPSGGNDIPVELVNGTLLNLVDGVS